MTQQESQSTLERYANWLEHPVTQQFRQHLSQQLSQLQAQWSSGNFTSDTVEKTALLNANAIGQCELLIALIENLSDPTQQFSLEQ